MLNNSLQLASVQSSHGVYLFIVECLESPLWLKFMSSSLCTYMFLQHGHYVLLLLLVATV